MLVDSQKPIWKGAGNGIMVPFPKRSPMHTTPTAFPASAPSACRVIVSVLLVYWASAQCPQSLAFLPPLSSRAPSRPYHHPPNQRSYPRTRTASTARVVVFLPAANHSNQEDEDTTKRSITVTDNNNDVDNKLAQLGYTPEELRRRRRPSSSSEEKEDIPVQVNLLPEIDAVTLTAVGFGLIAFNFFILANSGDGGLGGALATIINLSKQ